MFEKEVAKPIALAVATALVGSIAIGSVAQADTSVSPFAITTLSTGYLLGAAGEGTCGGDKQDAAKEAEGSCGGDKEAEGSCGGDKEGEAKEAEGSCGGDKEGEAKEDAEGKCGEGKCGAA